ncbi:peptidoglycan DD-metalloendopeptidase family protein [Pseudomaricurvus alcaniphilus]|uniref:peptidoglycan DD-metalloendopeptidase family protein n=1 Tax=Pseudomaricurvus alcaniphilus TaxID=1166482 RepID=UPI00313331CA
MRRFPKRHLVAAGVLGVALVVSTFLPPTDTVEPKRQSQTVELEIKPEIQQLLPPVAEPITEEIIPQIDWHKERVVSGDNLSLIFQRAGLSDRILFEFMAGHPESNSLKRIHPGHELEFHIEDGRLMALRYRQDRLTSQLFKRESSDKFSYEREVLQPDTVLAYRQATINDSLFLSAQRAQMDADMIMELANIFGWDIDFGLDIRKGDHFKVLYEERFLDGEKIGNGNILAAEFTNQKQTFKAVRYEDSNGNTHYYTPEGKSMRKAFLRAPLDFRRISSNFNPRRLHPISKTIKPHRGTDYAASQGTPVWSSGDGKVIASSYSKSNGNYVVIQHGNNIQTKYLHLHKRHVKTGQRVKQKQQIGTVGSTGYSTAPHLHYEFLLDGVHRNPRTILEKLPKARSVADAELQRFYSATQPLLASLESYHQQILLTRTQQE